MRNMRRFCGIRIVMVMSAAVCASGPAAADLSATERQSYNQAYTYAIHCFLANSAIHDSAGAKPAFDAAMKLGRALGYSNRRLNSDFADGGEMVKLARSDTYLHQTLADCAKLGMAGG